MKRSEFPLLIAIFLDLLGFGMIIIDIQFRAKGFGADGLTIGALLTSTFVIQLIASPKWGVLSDRIGRKPVLLICTVLSGGAMVVYGLATSLTWLFVSRVLSGFGAANVAVAQALISDTSTAEERTAAMGRIGAAISTGLIAGPLLGGTLAGIGQASSIGLVAGGCSLIGAVLIGVFVHSAARVPRERSKDKRFAIDLRLLKDLPTLRPLIIVAAVAWFSLATLEGTFGQLIKKTLGYGRVEFGLIFGYESLLSVLIQGLLLGWISKRIKEGPMIRIAYLFQGVGLAMTPFAPGLAVLFLASTFYAIGAGIANPTVNGIASKLTPADRQGELFGLLQATRSVGFAIGPVLGGILFDWHFATPYLLSGAVCVFAAIILAVPDRVETVVEAPRTEHAEA